MIFSKTSGWLGTRWGKLACVGACLLAGTAAAQETVTTLGGGPKYCVGNGGLGISGPYDGFVGGNTFQYAQFNSPSAIVLDAQSNLWLADTGNSDIEQISSVGNIASSVSSHCIYQGSTNSLTHVNALAMDLGGNLYAILPDNAELLKLQTAFPNLNLLASSPLPYGSPVAMTIDGASNLFVAYSGGQVTKCNLTNGASIASFTTVVSSFTWEPSGIALCANGRLAVSDILSNGIYLVATNANSTPSLLAGGVAAGFADGGPGSAEFNQPAGIAASADGHIVVCDENNNRVRLLDAFGNTTTLYGTSSNEWSTAQCCACKPQIFPGWLDGAPGSTGDNAAGRLPLGVAVSSNGTVFVTEEYYDLLREVTGTSLSPVNLSASAPAITTEPATAVSTNSATLNANAFAGNEVAGVFFEWGTTPAFGLFTVTNVLSSGLNVTQVFSMVLTNQFNLVPGGTYYFQAVITNALGTNYGGVQSFSIPGIAPAALTLPASNVTTTSAMLNASVTPNGAITAVSFQWGVNTNYGSNTSAITLSANLSTPQSVSWTLTNLSPNTTYYYFVTALNSYGSSYGSPYIFTTSNLPPAVVTISPSFGYFPQCTTIAVTSTVPNVYYTTDGSTPTTNSSTAILTSNGPSLFTGYLEWCNPQSDLSSLRVAGISGGVFGAVTSGSAPPTNLIGFPRTVSVGSGSTAYIPMTIDLLPNAGSLQSLSFRVEIAPVSGAPPVTQMSLQPITSADYVPLVGPNSSDSAVTYSSAAYTNVLDNAFGLAISVQPNNGLDLSGFGVPVLLKVKVPPSAMYGAKYSMSVPVSTGDSASGLVFLSNMPPQTMQITDPIYLAGDCYPANGYNAGEFGNGSLEQGDLDTLLLAVNLVRTPPVDSDAYNAMDCFPDGGKHIGFGVISYNDWVVTLERALGLESDNWIRFWTNGGFLTDQAVNWTPGGAPVPLASQPKTQVSSEVTSTTPPGLVWFCQASISAGSLTNVAPGSVCSLPVSVSALSGYPVTGLDFRAVVAPDNGGPAIGQLSFNPAPGVLAPYTQLQGLASNDIICAWVPSDFEPALGTGSNFIGDLTFQVPSTAQAGQSYSVHFLYVGGSSNETNGYDMESFPGAVWVKSSAGRPASITSDTWKTAFFGSYTNAAAADSADPDGDGSPNWQEYLAGTNPTNSASCFQFTTATPNPGGSGAVLNWLTAPGKTYVVQSIPILGGTQWTSVNTNYGDGNYYQLVVTNQSGSSRFYRIQLQP